MWYRFWLSQYPSAGVLEKLCIVYLQIILFCLKNSEVFTTVCQKSPFLCYFKKRRWGFDYRSFENKDTEWGCLRSRQQLPSAAASYPNITEVIDDFGGLVVSMLTSGTQVRGFKPGRSRWIFTDVKILSMPSHLSHVPALRHVKEPSNLRELRIVS